jgi:hypothetical protein
MAKGEGMPQITRPSVDDTEPYRRLVELQKQLIEMARQHKQARRDCDTLREQVAHEIMASLSWRGRLRQRLNRSATAWLKRLSRLLTGAPFLRPLNDKQSLPC